MKLIVRNSILCSPDIFLESRGPFVQFLLRDRPCTLAKHFLIVYITRLPLRSYSWCWKDKPYVTAIVGDRSTPTQYSESYSESWCL